MESKHKTKAKTFGTLVFFCFLFFFNFDANKKQKSQHIHKFASDRIALIKITLPLQITQKVEDLQT